MCNYIFHFSKEYFKRVNGVINPSRNKSTDEKFSNSCSLCKKEGKGEINKMREIFLHKYRVLK